MEILKQLKGLEVVDVVSRNDEEFAILFDDGIILQVNSEGTGFYQGTGWEALWELLKRGN